MVGDVQQIGFGQVPWYWRLDHCCFRCQSPGLGGTLLEATGPWTLENGSATSFQPAGDRGSLGSLEDLRSFPLGETGKDVDGQQEYCRLHSQPKFPVCHTFQNGKYPADRLN